MEIKKVVALGELFYKLAEEQTNQIRLYLDMDDCTDFVPLTMADLADIIRDINDVKYAFKDHKYDHVKIYLNKILFAVNSFISKLTFYSKINLALPSLKILDPITSENFSMMRINVEKSLGEIQEFAYEKKRHVSAVFKECQNDLVDGEYVAVKDLVPPMIEAFVKILLKLANLFYYIEMPTTSTLISRCADKLDTVTEIIDNAVNEIEKEDDYKKMLELMDLEDREDPEMIQRMKDGTYF